MAQEPTAVTGKKLNAIIQTRHDTSANMARHVYEGGELFYETDTKQLKIGDGITQASSIEALNKSYTFTDGVKESNGIVSTDYDKVVAKPATNGVLIKKTSGITTNNYGTGASANYIVQRDANGQITVPLTPTDQAHASSKKYVDDTKSALQNNIDGKISFSNLNQKAPVTNETTLQYIYDEDGDTQWMIPQGTYTKPSAGIPKSDLASDVQTSLRKADTAIQSHQSIKTLNTNHTSSQPIYGGEAIVGSGTINLHRVSKTGEFQHLRNRGESFLEWGGANLTNSRVSPIDASLISVLGANRLAFANPSGITVEYSNDSGSTWVDFGASTAAKYNLTACRQGSAFYCGGPSTTSSNINNMLRITFNTKTANVYTVFEKFAIYISTSGATGSYVTLRCRTHTNVASNTDTWTTFVDKQAIDGDSGWNIINTRFTSYGYSNSQYEEVQFVFGYTGINSSYPASSFGLIVYNIFGYGGVGWNTPSQMAKDGHLYKYDYLQNATFPALVYATQFVSTRATGQPPLIANSTTKVSNLNSDYLDGQHGDYYLDYTNLTNKPTLVNKVSVTGTGNAITTASVSGDTITLRKGSTFATLGGNNFTSSQYVAYAGKIAEISNCYIRLANDGVSGYPATMLMHKKLVVEPDANTAYELTIPNKTDTIATLSDVDGKIDNVKALSITIY